MNITTVNNLVIKRINEDTNYIDHSSLKINKSENTIKIYFFYLKKFIDFISHERFEILKYDTKINIEEITMQEMFYILSNVKKDDITAYIHNLILSGNKNTTINNILNYIKYFFILLNDEFNLDIPIKKSHYLKEDKFNYERYIHISKDDINKVLNSIKINDIKSLRNYLLIYMIFMLGNRSTETLNLKFEDITDEYILLKETKNKEKVRKVIPESLLKKITDFKETIQKFYKISEEELKKSYVFCSNYNENKKLSYSGIYKIINETFKRTLNKSVSPHMLRHATAIEMVKKGAEAHHIREQLGQKSLIATDHYLKAKKIINEEGKKFLPDI